MQDATQTENDEVEETEDDDEELVAPNTRNVENSFEILKNLSQFSEKRDDQMQDLINRFETLLMRDASSKQVKIKTKIHLHCHTLIFFLCLLVHLLRHG